MENKSQVLLKAGDRVLTSKGNIGEVVEANILIGYYLPDNTFVLIERLHIDCSWDKMQDIIRDHQIDRLDKKVIGKYSIPLVKIGSKSYPISADQLTKLDTLFPVRVIWNTYSPNDSRDIETVVYLPKDFCLLCNGDKPGGNNLYSRIIPLLQSQVGVRDYITIFKIYAL